MGFYSQYYHRAMQRRAFGKAGALDSAPTALHVGLSSTTPTVTGTNVTEPSGGAYARVSVSAANWADATDANPSVVANGALIEFATATANWVAGANLTHAVLYDAASAGNFLGAAAITVAQPVLNGNTAKLAAGTLTFSLRPLP